MQTSELAREQVGQVGAQAGSTVVRTAKGRTVLGLYPAVRRDLLAKKIGRRLETTVRILRGQQVPGIELLQKIAVAVGQPVEDVMRDLGEARARHLARTSKKKSKSKSKDKGKGTRGTSK